MQGDLSADGTRATHNIEYGSYTTRSYTVEPALDVWAFVQLLLTLWTPKHGHGHHADQKVLRDLDASKKSYFEQVSSPCMV